MNNFNDYVDGTAYIILLKSDFKDERRFNQYARFMCLEGQDNITIPIDSEKAREQFIYWYRRRENDRN